MNKKNLFLPLVLVFLLGCKNSTSPDIPEVMMPLTLGNSWTYDDTSYTYPGFIQYSGTFTVTLTGSTIMKGKKYELFDDILTGPTRNDGEGTWRLSIDSSHSEYLLYKYPGFVGDTFNFDTVTFTSANLQELTIYGYTKIITTDTLITVPSGTFKCYGYESDNFTIKDGKLYSKDFYYASPNIGFIKGETYSLDRIADTLYLQDISRLIAKNFN